MMGIRATFFKIVGPAAVIAAGTMGGGTTSSLILAGAWFRYDLLWVALLILPLFVIAIDSASRIGLVNKDQGMFSLIREHIHPGVAWLILAINIPVHLFIAMAHMSIMTSAFISLLGYHPPETTTSNTGTFVYYEVLLSVLFAAGVIWLLASEGYQRMQRIMTAFMVLMFICFLIVAVRGFQELIPILSGFVPSIPADIQIPELGLVRDSGISAIAIVGSVLAPAALLGIPYMSADNHQSTPVDFKDEFRRSIIALGIFYGGYSLCVIIAGGFALFPLANHAQIDSVHEASNILVKAFPSGLQFLGPVLFKIGIFMAALTTFVVIVEVISYFCLDMFSKNWHYTKDNKTFKKMLVICIALPACLAPLWSFPALFKNLLLMGVNAIVIPLVFLALIILMNKKTVMQEYTASITRNVFLYIALILSVVLSVVRFPEFIEMFKG